MSEVPPAYYKWAQFSDICTCGKRVAIDQRKFGILTSESLNNNMMLKESRINTIKKLGVKRICCLREFTNFPNNFICDRNLNAYTDVTISKGKSINQNLRGGNNSTEIGFEFLPKTNGKMGFDLNRYCLKLSQISLSNFDKMGILRTDGSNPNDNIPQFPNYKSTKTENFPAIQSEIPPLTNEELTLQFLVPQEV